MSQTNDPANPNTPASGGPNPGENPGATPDPNKPNPGAPAPDPKPGEPPKLYTQDDLNRIAGNVREEEKRKLTAALDDEKRKAEEQRLKEQGEWKIIAEQKDRELQELQATVSRKDRESLCLRIATEEKLPANLAARLQGNTEDEIRIDAQMVAKFLAPPSAPNHEFGNQPNGAGAPLTDEQIRERKHADLPYSSLI